MPDVLVTGATGFIGSRIVHLLQASGVRVRTCGRTPRPRPSLPNYVCTDLIAAEDCRPLLQGVGIVIHAAGLAHRFRLQPGEEGQFYQANAVATEKLTRASAEAGVEQFVLLSSVSVYGRHTRTETSESDPCHPDGPYALSKFDGERRALSVATETGMPVTILRPATVYGEQDPGNVARLMAAIDRNRFVWIGTGENLKSLIHRDDVARACLAVVEALPQTTGIYNLSGPPCAMRDIVEGLAVALRRRLPRWRIPARVVRHTTRAAAWLTRGRGRLGALHHAVQKWLIDDVYSGRKFEQTFHFQHQVHLAEGLSREVQWYRSCHNRNAA